MDVISERPRERSTVRRGSVIALDGGGHALFQVRGNVSRCGETVRLGLTNFERTEILEGLEQGDEIILSDMSDYANRKEIRIR